MIDTRSIKMSHICYVFTHLSFFYMDIVKQRRCLDSYLLQLVKIDLNIGIVRLWFVFKANRIFLKYNRRYCSFSLKKIQSKYLNGTSRIYWSSSHINQEIHLLWLLHGITMVTMNSASPITYYPRLDSKHYFPSLWYKGAE